MKNFGNRFGFRNNYNFDSNIYNKFNEPVIDARKVLTAKRNYNSNSNVNEMIFDRFADPRIFQQNRLQHQTRMQEAIGFGIHMKTVPNDLYVQEKFKNYNLNSRLNLSTNKFTGKNFSDLTRSQGIFSNNNNHIIMNQKSNIIKRGGNLNFDNSFQSKRPYLDKVNDIVDKSKVPRDDSNMGKIKFNLENFSKSKIDNSKRPALSTTKFNTAPKMNSLVSPIQGYRIEVKNLHSQVNVDDVYELFTSLGSELRSCNLVRPGYAEVVFRHLTDAKNSLEEFHGRELDGRPMNLKLVTAAVESTPLTNEMSNNDVKLKITQIQANRKPVHNILINKDAVFRSMYSKHGDTSKVNKKPFKFSVTL